MEDYVGLGSGFFAFMYPDSRPVLSLAVGAGGEIESVSAATIERAEGTIELTVPCAAGGCDAAVGPPVVLAEPIGPDGRLVIGYEPANFELGETTRTVEVRSPQVAAPTTIAFNVTQRLVPIWIIVIALAGLLLGLLVRSVLTPLIAKADLQRARLDTEELIEGLAAKYPHDEIILAAVGQARATLQNRKLTAEQLAGIEAPLNEALTKADAVWAERATALETTAVGVRGTWNLPPSVSGGLALVRDALQAET